MTDAAVESGTGRVRLSFRPEGGEVRVPAGTTVFDAASWNGIAIDSTCGGHGTCRKCKVRVASGDVPIDAVDPRAFSPDELRDGWRLACRAMAAGDLEIDVPPLQTRPKAALVGVGRHVILRPSVQKRHVDARGAVARGPGLGPRADRGGGRRHRAPVPPGGCADGRPHPAAVELRRHGRRLRRARDRRRARRHHRAAARDRLRPRHDDGRRDPARPEHRPAAGRAVGAEPPAAVRGRRDLARLGDDARSRRARGAPGPRRGDAQPARRRGVRRGGRRRRGRLRDGRVRQRHDDPDRARHRSRAAGRGAVHRHRPPPPAGDGARLRRPHPPAGAGVRLPRARGLRRRRHRGRDARDGPHPRPPPAPLHRRRHELRDRARVERARASRPPRRPARRSRRPRSAAGCVRPRGRSRA